jgi:hypothetical protein
MAIQENDLRPGSRKNQRIPSKYHDSQVLGPEESELSRVREWENGKTLGTPGERHRDAIRDFAWPELDDAELDNTRFQQDGATCHTG